MTTAARARGFDWLGATIARMPNDVPGHFTEFRFPHETPWIIADGSSNVSRFRWLPTDGSTPDLELPHEFAGTSPIYGFNFGDGVLEVEFLSGGRTYQYFPTAFDLYLAMISAPSRGKYVWNVIRQVGLPYIRIR